MSCCIVNEFVTVAACANEGAGGIADAYIANFKDVLLPFGQNAQEADCKIINDINMCAGKCFFNFTMNEETGNLVEDITRNQGNVNATLTLTGSFNFRDCPALRAKNALIGGRFVVLFKDNNGYWWVVGVKSGLTATINTNTGTARTDPNVAVVTLTATEGAFTGGIYRFWAGLFTDTPAARDAATQNAIYGAGGLLCTLPTGGCGCEGE